MTNPRLDSLGKALGRLDEALQEPESELVRDAAIQRFEFCFELAWKAVQAALREQGGECNSPRACLREAFKADWVQDEQPWVDAMADRNLTSHTYDEELAKQVYARLPTHLATLKALHSRLEQGA